MAKKKLKKKSPYGGYTFEEILKAEKESYVIQVGNNVFDLKGKLVFDKGACAVYYNQILDELCNSLDGGDLQEQAEALVLLGTLRIHKLRIH